MASLIRYNRVLVKESPLMTSRLHPNSGKKMDSSQAQAILLNDCLLVCTLPEMELEAVVRWTSILTSRDVSVSPCSRENQFVVTSPTDGTIITFECASEAERDDWISRIEVERSEWIAKFYARLANQLSATERESLTFVNPSLLSFSISHTLPVMGFNGKVFTAFVTDFIFRGREYYTIKRYSEFDKLHQRCQAAFKSQKGLQKPPCFPSKRYFADNTETRFIRNRCFRLQAYLNQSVRHSPRLIELPFFQEFLFESVELYQRALAKNPPRPSRPPFQVSVSLAMQQEDYSEEEEDSTEKETLPSESSFGAVSPRRFGASRLPLIPPDHNRPRSEAGMRRETPFSRGLILPGFERLVKQPTVLRSGDRVTIIGETKPGVLKVYFNSESYDLPARVVQVFAPL